MFFSKKLKKVLNLKHCFFSRKNGGSKGIYSSLNWGFGSRDSKKNVIDNINIVNKKLKCKKTKIVTLHQTHSNKVVFLNNIKEIEKKLIGDSMVTKIKNIGISILTADCVPILICDPKKKIIGCIHAGWKGALNGIVENTVNKFLELNSNVNDLVSAVGPCIGHKSYEVKYDLYEKFIIKNKSNKKFFTILDEEKYLFNIRNFIDSKLVYLGIKNIDHIKMDTFLDEKNFFSYRRSLKNNDKDYGRCISVIIMT